MRRDENEGRTRRSGEENQESDAAVECLRWPVRHPGWIVWLDMSLEFRAEVGLQMEVSRLHL